MDGKSGWVFIQFPSTTRWPEFPDVELSATLTITANDRSDVLRLIHGDALDVLADLPPNSIDMVLCDPPYGTTRNRWDTPLDLGRMWAALAYCCRPGAAKVFTATQPFSGVLVCSNLKEFRYEWVWVKSAATGHLNARRRPMQNHESVLVFSREKPPYNPQGLIPFNRTVRRGGNGGCYGASGQENFQEYTGYPRSCLQISSAGATVHPTQKPVELMEYLIKTYTDEGDTVLDFCMGSGTTGVAALNLRRKFVGVEIEKEYFDKAEARCLDAEIGMIV